LLWPKEFWRAREREQHFCGDASHDSDENYWVRNYLMGNPPPTFDILDWNSDTRGERLISTAADSKVFAGNLLTSRRRDSLRDSH